MLSKLLWVHMGICSPLPGKHSFRGAFHHLRPLQSFCSLGYSRPWALGEEYDMNVWCRDEHFEWNKIKIKREDMAAHRYGNEGVKCSYSYNLSLDFSSLRRAKQVSLPQRPVIHNALTFRAQDFRFFFFGFLLSIELKVLLIRPEASLLGPYLPLLMEGKHSCFLT